MKAGIKPAENPCTLFVNKNNVLLPVPSQNPRTPHQAYLEIRIARQKEIYGVGMGVLSDGTPYLTGRVLGSGDIGINQKNSYYLVIFRD